MEHIAALLLIVGCSNGLDQCRELQAPLSVFETMAECATARPEIVKRLQDPKQKVFSRCLVVDPALEDDYDQIIWNVQADGTFDASLGVAGMVVASNAMDTRMRRN